MERVGEVIAVQGDNLVIQFCRPSDCEKCHACMGGESQRQLMVKGQAQVGDQAVVEMPAQKILGASALAYALPLAGLLAGLFAGSAVYPQDQNLGALVGAVIGLALPLAWIALTEHRRRADASWQPRLVKIIPRGQENEV